MFFRKIHNIIERLRLLIRISYVKLLYPNLILGKNILIKETSRLKIWSNKGRIIIGDNFSMGYNSEVYAWDGKLNIGDNTSINDNCKLYGDLEIGANCLLASNIFISSGTHVHNHIPEMPIKNQDKIKKSQNKICVGDDCWIGFGVVIMPGVNIGKGAIIGANSVVTKDIDPYTINAGIPAKKIKNRIDFYLPISKIECSNHKSWPYFYSGFNYKDLANSEESSKNGITIAKKEAIVLLHKTENILTKLSICLASDFISETSMLLYINSVKISDFKIRKGNNKYNLSLEKNIYNESSINYESLPSYLANKFHVIKIVNADNIKLKYLSLD